MLQIIEVKSHKEVVRGNRGGRDKTILVGGASCSETCKEEETWRFPGTAGKSSWVEEKREECV